MKNRIIITKEPLVNTVNVPASLITSFPLGPSNTITTVSIPNFRISTTEVTNKLWNYVRIWASKQGYLILGNGNFIFNNNTPVYFVSWYDAIVWLNAYSEKNLLEPVYRDTNGNIVKDASKRSILNSVVVSNNNGYRLPTNIEFELAARWIGTLQPTIGSLATDRLTTTNFGVTYYWTPDNYASGATGTSNTEINQVNSPEYSSVFTATPNALGIYGMTGNGNEWIFDGAGNPGNRGWKTDSCGSIAASGSGTSTNTPQIYLRNLSFRFVQKI